MKQFINSFLILSFSLSLSSCTTMMKKAPDGQTHESAKINERDPFLNANSTKAGVVTTPSGLQYMVLTQGTGLKPSASDTVKVHYKGTLTDGTEFDSSYKRGEPISFPLNGVIAGWTEGVQLMNVGSKYRFYIPSRLAYGDSGKGLIPGGATLIFDVELLGIQ